MSEIESSAFNSIVLVVILFIIYDYQNYKQMKNYIFNYLSGKLRFFSAMGQDFSLKNLQSKSR